MSDTEELHQRANFARAMLRRVGDDGSVLEQIENGQWDAALLEQGNVDEAVALLGPLAEQVRYTRVALERLTQPQPSVRASLGTAEWSEQRLPFNRKERYFTGTVLPMIVGSDGFAHLDRLLRLCGLDATVKAGLDGTQDLQFFTEYSFNESVMLEPDRDRFSDRPAMADTPDLVIGGPDWLLAIEAKVFDQPSPADLKKQLERQGTLVSYWAEKFGLAPERVSHVALLPESLARRVGALAVPTVTWEDVAESYRNVAPRYWLDVLDHALASALYGDPSRAFGENAHAKLTGRQIQDGVLDVESGAPFLTMGRFGGLEGPGLTQDLASGAWRAREYEVRRQGEPNANWFPIAELLDLLPADPGQ